MDALPTSENHAGTSRARAALYISPFIAIGVADVVLLLFWGLDPLWGFMILPPILAVSVLAWVAFRGGLARDRTGEPDQNGFDRGY